MSNRVILAPGRERDLDPALTKRVGDDPLDRLRVWAYATITDDEDATGDVIAGLLQGMRLAFNHTEYARLLMGWMSAHERAQTGEDDDGESGRFLIYAVPTRLLEMDEADDN